MRALLLVVLAGCELYFAEPDQTHIDPDGGGVQPIESIVGRWRQLPSPSGGDGVLAEIVFRADGTYTSRERSGWYHVDNGVLEIDRADGHRWRESFVLQLDRLILEPYRPANSNDGIAGRWTQSALRADGVRSTRTIELRGDRTGTWSSESEAHTGTWRVRGDELELLVTIGGEPVALRWRFLDQLALGFPLYAREKP